MTDSPSFLSRTALRCGRRWRAAAALRRNENGSAAVEFAIIAPIFFFLMFVIAETALVFVAEQVMDNAVFETARLIRTGQAQSADPPMTKQEFRDNVCGRMSVFISCGGGNTNFYLDVKSYDSFDDMDVSPPVNTDETFKAEGDYNFGTSSDIVIVRAYYQWPINPVMGRQWTNAMDNGKLLIGSFAAFCNEPYETGGGAAGGCS